MLIQKERIPVKQVLLIGFLPNFLKLFVYRLKGYKIGRGVRIGFGAIVCGERVTVGNRTEIGFFSIVRGKDIAIESHVKIGSFVFLDTPYIKIGEGSKINEQVFVGGLQSPDSRFELGRNCQVMQMTFINPARSVVVGDDSGIGGNCLVFGHTSWLSHFEGYPVEFLPIEIGKSVSIAWGAFLLPGSKIGDGAVVGASSVVSREIPPRCLAIGYPARVIQKYPDFPREVSEKEKIEILRKIVEEMVDTFQKSGLSVSKEGSFFVVRKTRQTLLKSRRVEFRFIVFDEPLSDQDPFVADDPIPDVCLSLFRIPDTVKGSFNQKKIMWIDVESKEQSQKDNDLGDEIILFLRRYGVRFTRTE